MDFKSLKADNMVNTGSTVLKVLQNNNMPLLDLLVREAIQNSLDAKLDNKNFVKENISIGEFDCKELSSNFSIIENNINNKYQNQNKFISFSDSNTTGLTGPIKVKDVKNGKWGKFLSLIKNVGKAQENEGAGGSWGYGKTVYYRLGIGLVIFYTRIFEDGEFKSRLMACLVENEMLNDNLIPDEENDLKSGIAWWGKLDNGEINPIEDENEIEKILKIFNLKKYDNDETGTTVIIPFINESKLLEETYDSDISNVPFWCKNIKDYLCIAVQRWYGTRLMNKDFKDNPWLNLFINGEQFNVVEMLPLFKIIQKLYNYNDENGNNDDEIHIKTQEILLRNNVLSNARVGKIVYTRVNKNQLGMNMQEPSPYTQINNIINSENYTNHHIVAFCRKPGMILRYDYDGNWTNGLSTLNENEYEIALFLPNSNNLIKTNDAQFSFEEYLRASEKADHENWTDITQYITKDGTRIDTSNFRFIDKIQSQIIRKLNNEEVEKIEQNFLGVGTKLTRQLTELFMPKVGFGTMPRPKNNGSKGEKEENIRTTKSKLTLGKLKVKENSLVKNFEILVSKTEKELKYIFKIDTENNAVGANEWEQKENIKFPAKIISINLLEIITHEENKEIELKLDEKYSNDSFEFEPIISEKYGIFYGFKFNIKNDKIEKIVGNIEYEVNADAKVKVIINKG